jgi:hypothetical protein
MLQRAGLRTTGPVRRWLSKRREETTMAEPKQPKPGDDAPSGTPGTGENVCPACRGSGKIGGATCESCAGTGVVIEAIGGA